MRCEVPEEGAGDGQVEGVRLGRGVRARGTRGWTVVLGRLELTAARLKRPRGGGDKVGK